MLVCTFRHPGSGGDCCATIDDGVLTIVNEATGATILVQTEIDIENATDILLIAGVDPRAIQWES